MAVVSGRKLDGAWVFHSDLKLGKAKVDSSDVTMAQGSARTSAAASGLMLAAAMVYEWGINLADASVFQSDSK